MQVEPGSWRSETGATEFSNRPLRPLPGLLAFVECASMGNSFHPERFTALDAARGAAMLFVCISHFGASLVQYKPLLAAALARIGMVATPSFVLLSGMLMGYLWEQSPGRRERLRWKLIDRGLFLVTVAHLMMALPHLLLGHSRAEWLSVPVTDALGVAMIAASLLAVRYSHREIVMIGLLTYVAAWVLYFWWDPKPTLLHVLSEMLVGNTSAPHVFSGVFPLLPLVAVYLCAVPVGSSLAKALATGGGRAFARRLQLAGILMAASGILAHLILYQSVAGSSALGTLSSLVQKYPPGPAYLLLFGGSGLVLIGVMIEVSMRWPHFMVVRALASGGRASLFIFLAQYYIYYIFYPRHGAEVAHWWPLALLVSIAILMVAGHLWSKKGLNRLLSLGLRPPRRTPVSA